jgi:hypothetical protein
MITPEQFVRCFEDQGCDWSDSGFRVGVDPNVSVRLESNWLTYSVPGEGRHPEGLWKMLGADYVAEIPSAVFAELDPEELEPVLAQVSRWLITTAAGRVPAGWLAPKRSELDQWVPVQQRNLRWGAIFKSLQVEPDPFRLKCELASAITWPPGDTRRAWLVQALQDWQSACRMVRLSGAAGAVVAEVDITGAPELLWEPLVQAGLASLLGSLPLLVPVVELMNDRDLDIKPLEIPIRRCRVAAGVA